MVDYVKRHHELMLPTVRIRSGNVGGSGTVIHSKEWNGSGEWSTYVLTNHHVVDNLIEIKEEWSAVRGVMIKKDVLGTPNCDFFSYESGANGVSGMSSIEADIVSYQKEEDIAVLRLRTSKPVASVAKLYPRGAEKDLSVTMPVYAVGAAMGWQPVITEGMLSQFGIEIEERSFWLVTAPTIYGNSGGSLYLADTHELIGIPSRIAVDIRGFSADAITHLSFQTPITRVYDFLEAHYLRFIYDPDGFSEQSEVALKKRVREAVQMKITAAEQSLSGEEREQH